MMNKYILFAWNEFYPDGGLNDLVFDSDSIEDCVQFFTDHQKEFFENGCCSNPNYGQIINRDTWVIEQYLTGTDYE